MELPAFIEERFPYQRRQEEVQGLSMHLVDDGPEDADETVLLLHGNPSWSFLWRHLLGPLKEDGHRVIAPDLMGLGLSEKPISPAYYTLDRHVDNLVHLVQGLDLDGLTLVLHDWGGSIGMGLATSLPDRVDRIVIANTIAFPPRSKRSLSLWHKAFSAPVVGALGQKLNLVAHTAFRWGVADPLDPEVFQAYLWPLHEEGARVCVRRFVEMVPDGPDHPSAKTLARIQEGYAELQDKEALVLWADDDPVMRPKFAEKWADAFPQARVEHVSQHAKHFWQEDDPGAFLHHIRPFVGASKAR
jgi:haloalkane dehalogenase